MNSGPEYPLSPIPGSQAWFSSSRPLAEYLEQGAFQSMFVVWSMLYSNYRWYAHLLAPPFSPPPRFVSVERVHKYQPPLWTFRKSQKSEICE